MSNIPRHDLSDREVNALYDYYLAELQRRERGHKLTPSSHVILDGRARDDREVVLWLRHISTVIVSDGILKPLDDFPPTHFTGRLQQIEIRSDLERRGYPDHFGQTDDDRLLEYEVAINEAYKVLECRVPVKPVGNPTPTQFGVTKSEFPRSVAVIAYVLYEADGKCELCGQDAPFVTDAGRPFLEVHHIKHLAQGGADTVDNTVALCPNCHRKCHYSGDRIQHVERLYSDVDRLHKPNPTKS